MNLPIGLQHLGVDEDGEELVSLVDLLKVVVEEVLQDLQIVLERVLHHLDVFDEVLGALLGHLLLAFH